MKNTIILAFLGVVLLVATGCAGNQYNLTDQPDYRDGYQNGVTR